MAKSRAVRILGLTLLGVALATPVVVACACQVPAPEPMPVAGCHAPLDAALTAGCCCVESPAGEVDSEPPAMPAPRVVTMVTASVAVPIGTLGLAPDPTPAPIRAVPSRHTVPLRL